MIVGVEQGMIFNISPGVVSLYKYCQDMEDDWSSQVHHNFSIVHLMIHNTIITAAAQHYQSQKDEEMRNRNILVLTTTLLAVLRVGDGSLAPTKIW